MPPPDRLRRATRRAWESTEARDRPRGAYGAHRRGASGRRPRAPARRPAAAGLRRARAARSERAESTTSHPGTSTRPGPARPPNVDAATRTPPLRAPSPPAPRRRQWGRASRAGFYRAFARAACNRRRDWRASSTPTACAGSSGRRRASQPRSVRPARRVVSGTVGPRIRRPMSVMRRARSLASTAFWSSPLRGLADESGAELSRSADSAGHSGSWTVVAPCRTTLTLPFASSFRDTRAQAYPALRGRRAAGAHRLSTKTSRSFAPFEGPTSPRRSMVSTMRAARL